MKINILRTAFLALLLAFSARCQEAQNHSLREIAKHLNFKTWRFLNVLNSQTYNHKHNE